MALPSIALPGQLLGHTTKYLPGPGTHIHDSQIYASISGTVISSPNSKPASKSTPSLTPLLLSITRPAPPSTSGILGPSSGGGTTVLPTVSSTVLCSITRLTPRSASCLILAINNTPCREAFSAQIRREDIRATEKDKIRMEESFRVGDLVRGTVVSLGDSGSYYVATDGNEYGVVVARGEASGRVLYPVSWREVRDPVLGRGEPRKVAKPF